MKKYNYTYITTNLINGKQYVGDHSTNNLNDNYLGSGINIQRAIKKYGKENFERKILEKFETKEQAFDAQEKYINEHNTLVPIGYNISPLGGIGVSGCFTKETRKKISEALLGHKVSLETRKKIGVKSKIYTLGHKVSPETRKKIGEGNAISLKGKKQSKEAIKNRTGWKHSNEAKSKIGEANKNSNKYTKERSKKIWETRRKNGTDKLSNEHKEKISFSLKNKNKNKNDA